MTPFRNLTSEILIWSRFSEEKQIDFNGSLVASGKVAVLVDPVAMSDEQIEVARRLSPVAIVLTNKDHRRAAPEVKKAFGGIPIWIHELDKPLVDCPVDRTFVDGDRLPGDLVAIHLPALKSPGETALLHEGGEGTLILGDALLGKPAGSLSLLPAPKIADANAARESLAKLLAKRFDVLMVGDGAPFLSGGHEALSKFLA